MSTMVPMYGFGSGGGTGAALTVNAPSGCTVTVSKDGKAKTKIAGTDGVAVFKGLATGQWTVTITDGEQTAQKTVTITADYAVELTFFSATIGVTYPEGSTCTCTDGTNTLTAPDTTGSHTFTVPNTGTWTVTATDGSRTVSKEVTIAAAGQVESLVLSYRLYLYNYGDKCEDVTSGWQQYAYNGLQEGRFVFNDDNILVYGWDVKNAATVVSMVSFDPNLLSQFSQLKYTVSIPEGTENKLCILPDMPSSSLPLAYVDCNGVAGTYAISLDNISSGWPALFSYKGSQQVHAVWLE